MADADLAIQPRKADVDVQPRPRARRFRVRRLVRFGLLALGPILAIAVAAHFYLAGGRFASTDDAYIKAHKLSVSAQIAGKVVDVAVQENQIVEKGQLLFRIKDDRYRTGLANAEAQLETVRNSIRQMHATYRMRMEALTLGKTNIAYYERDYQRYQSLAQRGVATQQRFEQAAHNLAMAREQMPVIQAAANQAVASLGGEPNMPDEERPEYKAALAQLERARIDLDDTIVTAPERGVIAQVSDFRPGDFVTPGQPLFTIIETDPMWVEANFKETDLTHMRVGQHATLKLDTYPDVTWDAVVESIAPATGSEFSLLPPQNASGNWVKVVQRLPVRLAVHDQAGHPPLRAGMSVDVEVDTEHRRHLPSFIRSALAAVGAEEDGSAQAGTPGAP